jgi:tartrate-resistant acid phosphatase type 5
MRKIAISMLGGITAFCGVLGAQQDLGRVIPEKQPLHFVALGDFGSGDKNQLAVANALALRNRQEPFDFGISLGDNFYRCGVSNSKDPDWKSRWEDLYTPLGIPFFASLGNHDYGHPPIICPGRGASPDAEVKYTEFSKSWRMPARYYTFVAGNARFFAIDTEGWSSAQLTWLKKTLMETQNELNVQWRIVYGHHPMYTSGVHLNQRRIGQLRRELAGLFKQTKIDLYIAGHDHDMEHLRADGIEYLICGAGGAKLRRIRTVQPESVFHATTFGFLDLSIDEHSLTAKFLDTKLVSLEKPEMRVAK